MFSGGRGKRAFLVLLPWMGMRAPVVGVCVSLSGLLRGPWGRKRVWSTETRQNDNTTQMSVAIVDNKSTSSLECASTPGPSDSLITTLSRVCLLPKLLPAWTRQPPLSLLLRQRKAAITPRRLWIWISTYPREQTKRSEPQSSPNTPTSFATETLSYVAGSHRSKGHYTLAKRWHCGGSSQTSWKTNGHPSPGPSLQMSSGSCSIGRYLHPPGQIWWAWCCPPCP